MWKTLAVCSALALALAACSRSHGAATNIDLIRSGKAKGLAAACASPETLEGLKRLVFDHLSNSPAILSLNALYKDQLQAGATVSAAAPIVVSFDKKIHKLTCTARVTFAWPTDLVNRLRIANPAGAWVADTNAGAYSIQPQGAAPGIAYALDGAIYDNTAASVLTMMTTLTRADAQAEAQAAAAAAYPSAEVPPSSGAAPPAATAVGAIGLAPAPPGPYPPQ